MKIFISWSGNRSKYIAETLSNWTEQVLQAAEPWISTDIEKGKKWSDEINNKLKESKVAIICLTKDNLDSKWIHFEAGAVARSEDSHVCTFLFDISAANIQNPLSQFQSTRYNEEDILKLLKTINFKIGKFGEKSIKESNLESVFQTFWPQLKDMLDKTPTSSEKEIDPRSDRDLIEEMLQLLRGIKSNSSSSNIFNQEDLNEIVDFWIENYAKNKKIGHDSVTLGPHEAEIINYMSKIPEVKKIFGTGEILKRQVKDRIDMLLPF